MARIPIHDSVPIEDLAMEYALIVVRCNKGDLREQVDQSRSLMERMIGRCGVSRTNQLIEDAKNIVRLVIS